jgi:hypothetical protein
MFLADCKSSISGNFGAAIENFSVSGVVVVVGGRAVVGGLRINVWSMRANAALTLRLLMASV